MGYEQSNLRICYNLFFMNTIMIYFKSKMNISNIFSNKIMHTHITLLHKLPIHKLR